MKDTTVGRCEVVTQDECPAARRETEGKRRSRKRTRRRRRRRRSCKREVEVNRILYRKKVTRDASDAP